VCVLSVTQANNTGSSQAQALNQDGTPNTAANPAVPGSVISLFWTGGGAATPPLPDGQIAGPEASALAVPYPYGQPPAPQAREAAQRAGVS
jgi:uncharacterized protein (TIGR03437 family)